MEKEVENLFREFENLDGIEIIALGGSKVRGNNDNMSDYDVYIYYSKEIDIAVRKEILVKYTKYMEFKNTYWEEEDDGILKNGVEIEIIYRNINFLKDVYENVYLRGNTSFGYTTCMLENISSCLILYDKNGTMANLKKKIEVYPEELRKNIIFNNLELFYDKMPSIGYQVIKALKRRDYISINHRITEYLAIYFDIIFALNYKYHPGEKRLLSELSKLKCINTNAVDDIEKLLKNCMYNSELAIEIVEKISSDLNELVGREFSEFKQNSYKENRIK